MGSFPSAPQTYDRENEAQFRRAVELALPGASNPRTSGPVQSETLAAGDNDDFALGATTVTLRATPDASGSNLTGLVGGTEARKVRVVNLGSADLTITHQDTGSTAENRIITPDGASWVLAATGVVDLEYDDVTDRWRLVETASSLPRLTDLTFSVGDDGFDDTYASAWETSPEVTSAFALDLTYLRNGGFVFNTSASDPTPSGTQTFGFTNVGGGDGVADTHMVVANLKDGSGKLVDSKTVIVQSTI